MNSLSTQDTADIIESKKKKMRKRRDNLSIIAEFFSVLLICVLVLTFLFGIASVKGNSMYPSLKNGDLVVYYRLENSISAGDVIAFKDSDGEQYVKRVAAVAGDTVDFENGVFYVNNSAQVDNVFFDTEPKDSSTVNFPYTVKENEVFVLGDHRTDSVDSRDRGGIELDMISGKVIVCLRLSEI